MGKKSKNEEAEERQNLQRPSEKLKQKDLYMLLGMRNAEIKKQMIKVKFLRQNEFYRTDYLIFYHSFIPSLSAEDQ